MTTAPELERSDEVPRQRLTIAEIAEVAGVSVPTVSKVVNGRSDVAPETRAMVERVIRKHGFRRQRKPAGRTNLLELVFHELAGAYAMEVIKGVEEVAREHHLAVVLSELQGRHTPGRSWLDGMLSRRPAGVVSVFSGPDLVQLDLLEDHGIPLVLVDPTGEPLHDLPSVGASNWSGGLVATRHLLQLGHRRIGAITGPAGVLCSRARLDGYTAALDSMGVPFDPDLVCEGDFQPRDGLTHGRRLLAMPDPPTAIITGNDLQALGVYQAAGEAGRRIPDDLSVVGFDDLPTVQWLSPPLTTIRQPLAEMAAAATRMVVTLAQGEPLAQDRVEMATKLVLRASTAPPLFSTSRP